MSKKKLTAVLDSESSSEEDDKDSEIQVLDVIEVQSRNS